MPVPRDWALPFLEQARADLAVAWAIPANTRGSTFCMLLQMVFEKIAKAGFARSGQVVARSHQVAARFFPVLQRRPGGVKLLRENGAAQQFVLQLEAAQPSIARAQPHPGPQLEYPWDDPTLGSVCWPEADLPLVRRVRDPRDRIALDCLRFAGALEKELFTLIP
jgi:hypothetical protein